MKLRPSRLRFAEHLRMAVVEFSISDAARCVEKTKLAILRRSIA
jgi:hypothetical protein